MKTLYIFYAFTSAPPLPKDILAGQEDGLSTSVILAEDLESARRVCKMGTDGFNPDAYIQISIEILENTLASLKLTHISDIRIADNNNLKEI